MSVRGLTTIDEAAETFELPSYTLQRHIKGMTKISAEQASRYASLLNIDVAELLPRLDSNQQPAGSGIAA
jgi:plasmid maintenance system antidote protein VapI